MRSLFPKLTLAFLVVALVSVLVVGYAASSAAQRELDSYLKRGTSGQRLAAAASALSSYFEEHGSWDGVSGLVHSVADQGEGRLVLANSDGTIIADSAGRLTGKRIGRSALPLAAPIQVQQRIVGYVYFQLDEARPDLGPLGAMGRLMRRDMPGSADRSSTKQSQSGAVDSPAAGEVAAGGPIDAQAVGPAESSFLRSLADSLWLAALLATVVAVGLSVLLAHQIASPVRRLTRAAREVARGNLSQRVDVSSQDEIGELAAAFNAMADQLQRNELARRHMAADVAHELNTPLSVIRGNLEAMLDGVVPVERDQVASLYEESLLLSRLIADLRDLSLAEAGQLKLQRFRENVNSLIRRAAERLQPQVEAKGVTLQVEVYEDLPPVLVDGDRIVQVLANLLSNALRYTPSGGVITVGARRYGGAAGGGSSVVEITVSDTGAGIPAEDLRHVFDRFYRADHSRSRSTGGSGLGLAIVQQLVQAHGGKVWAESEEGRGSTFHFTLPCSAGMHPAVESA